MPEAHQCLGRSLDKRRRAADIDQRPSGGAEEDGAADTTIKVSWDDWQQMAAGQLDGMTAFMTGKLKIEGDMSNAMQLQGVLAKLRG